MKGEEGGGGGCQKHCLRFCVRFNIVIISRNYTTNCHRWAKDTKVIIRRKKRKQNLYMFLEFASAAVK